MTSSAHTVLGYLNAILARSRGEADDDRELLRRFVQARDGDAFAVLMRRHGPMVLGLARRVACDAQLAEDVFQAAFLMLARKAHTIRRAESLSCWLHGVAFRLALRVRRSRQRRQERESHVRYCHPPTPLDELSAQELLAVLDEELQQLPEQYRAVLILCCLEGLSQEEAAKRLGCSAGAVKGRLERGRNRLRLRLEKRGLTLPTVFGGTLLLTGSTNLVPAALAQATLQAATTGGDIAPAVAALMAEAMRTMIINKFKALGAAVLLLAVSGSGVGMMALRPQAAKENTAVPAVNDKPLSVMKHVDLYGDPLPEGAILRLGTLQRRAVGAQLAVTPDGKSIVTVRGGKYIAIWDAATGGLRQRRQLPNDVGLSLGLWELSPNGRWLAAKRGRSRLSLTIWETTTGRNKRDVLRKDTGNIRDCAFSPDGAKLATVGTQGTDCLVRVWNVSDGKRLFDQHVRARSCANLMFTRDSKALLAQMDTWQSTLYCWDIDSGRQRWQSKEIEPSPLVLTPDNKVLCWQQHESPALDLATGRRVKVRLPADAWTYSSLYFSPDGQTLLLSRLGDVTVWDYPKGELRRVLKGAGEPPRPFKGMGEQTVFAADGKSVIVNKGALQRWDLASGKAVWSDTFALGHAGAVSALAFSRDGRRLVSGSSDGSARLWDTTTGQPLHTWRGHERPAGLSGGSDAPSGVSALALTPDGSRLFSAGYGEILQLHDTRGGALLYKMPLHGDGFLEGPLHAYHLRISSDSERAFGLVGPEFFCNIVGHEKDKRTHRLATWDLKTGRLLATRDAPLNARLLSPDGRAILLANGVLLDAETGKEVVRLQEWPPKGNPAEFSADGALIVSRFDRLVREKEGTVANDDGACVWETATGKVVAHVKRNGWVAAASFHPDNRFVVLNHLKGVELWDLLRGETAGLRRMPEQVRAGNTWGSLVNCLAVTPDGRRLATGMPDGTILLWDISPPPSKPQRLEAKEVETLWADLTGADAIKAWRAVWRLADAPHDALPFLRGRVKPHPTATADLTRKLLANLDSDSFEVHEAAAKRVKELGLQAEPALRAALKNKPSLEQRRRIEELLTALPLVQAPPKPEELRQLRALIVLERIGTPEARRLLEEVAKGPQSARLTRHARAVLSCLR